MSDAESESSCDSGLDASGLPDKSRLDVVLDAMVSPTQNEILASNFSEDSPQELLLNKLSLRDFTVFVISEAGKPIYASCGYEEELSSLTALMQTFVMVVESWEDSLITMHTDEFYVTFSHRGPLIICIVTQDHFLLDVQVDIVYKQILSTLCRTQLLGIYEMKGPSFDIRILLKGMDRLISEILHYYRSDFAFSLKSVRVFPLPSNMREFIANTISSCVGDAKISNVIMGMVIVNRQLLSLVRMNGIYLHPFDLHIIVNIIECNQSIKFAHNWIPICLPHFNDTGFVHAFISYFSEDSSACLVLISLDRNAFELLRTAAENFFATLRLSKWHTTFEAFLNNPPIFELDSTLFSDLRHAVLKKNSVNQTCSSGYCVPYVSVDEIRSLQRQYRRVMHFYERSSVKELVSISAKNCIYFTETVKYKFFGTFSPFATRDAFYESSDRIFKMFRKDDMYFFSPSTHFS